MTAAKPPPTMEEKLQICGIAPSLKDAGPEVQRETFQKWAEAYQAIEGGLNKKLFYAQTQKALKGVLSAPKPLMDAALDDLRPDTEDDPEQGGLRFENLEPWDDEVEGEELLDAIAEVLNKYVVLPGGTVDAIALWVLFTYSWDNFDIYPYLNVTSVTKACGKTTLVSVLSVLVHKPFVAAHATTAALFRVMDQHHPTLLLDEADSFMKSNEDIRGMLNAGYQIGTPFVRCRETKDGHEPEMFDVAGPKLIAGIGNRQDTIEDRSVGVRLQRKTAAEKVERFRLNRLKDELAPLRRQSKRWAEDHAEALNVADPTDEEMPDLRSDRGRDNWRPLVAIAVEAGERWTERSRISAVLLDGTDKPEDDFKIQLVHDIDSIFKETGAKRLPSQDLCDALAKMEDRPWPEYGWTKKPITPTALARQLKHFKSTASSRGILPKTARVRGKTPRCYFHKDFKDTITRYPLPEVKQVQQASKDGDNRDIPNRNNVSDVAPGLRPENPHGSADVAGGINGRPEDRTADLFEYEKIEREAIQGEPESDGLPF